MCDDVNNAHREPTCIDLFSGAGGMTLGFEMAGFRNVFSVDSEPSFCDTYEKNFPSHNLLRKDITSLTNDDIKKAMSGKNVDIVIGGPPCQGFSIAGNIGRRFVDDPRNHLFKEFARIVEIVQPTYFVIENVARLFTHNGGKTRDEIISVFEKQGYKVKCQVLNTADFGIPQNRRRVIFVGSKVSADIELPSAKNQAKMTVKETIGKFPPLRSGETSDVHNHTAMRHSEQMLEKMRYVSDGGNRSEIPETIRPKTGDVRKYIRYKSDEPSVCVTGDMRKIFHYSQNRALTVRELAAIQTFPDNFVFLGSSISQQQQVGNAVPPLFAKEIALAIKRMIEANA